MLNSLTGKKVLQGWHLTHKCTHKHTFAHTIIHPFLPQCLSLKRTHSHAPAAVGWWCNHSSSVCWWTRTGPLESLQTRPAPFPHTAWGGKKKKYCSHSINGGHELLELFSWRWNGHVFNITGSCATFKWMEFKSPRLLEMILSEWRTNLEVWKTFSHLTAKFTGYAMSMFLSIGFVVGAGLNFSHTEYFLITDNTSEWNVDVSNRFVSLLYHSALTIFHERLCSYLNH